MSEDPSKKKMKPTDLRHNSFLNLMKLLVVGESDMEFARELAPHIMFRFIRLVAKSTSLLLVNSMKVVCGPWNLTRKTNMATA
jgi:hypothetical protein